MPTIARRPAAQKQRERLQGRRLHAAELFATGIRQAEIARQLGVSPRAVSACTLGVKVSDKQLAAVPLARHDFHGGEVGGWLGVG